jgi:hypothetical protein
MNDGMPYVKSPVFFAFSHLDNRDDAEGLIISIEHGSSKGTAYFFNIGRKFSMNQNSISIPLSPEKAIFCPSGDKDKSL